MRNLTKFKNFCSYFYIFFEKRMIGFPSWGPPKGPCPELGPHLNDGPHPRSQAPHPHNLKLCPHHLKSKIVLLYCIWSLILYQNCYCNLSFFHFFSFPPFLYLLQEVEPGTKRNYLFNCFFVFSRNSVVWIINPSVFDFDLNLLSSSKDPLTRLSLLRVFGPTGLTPVNDHWNHFWPHWHPRTV